MTNIKNKNPHLDLNQLVETLNSSMLISVYDLSKNIIFANTLFCQISGYSLEDLLNQKCRIFDSDHHPKDYWTELWSKLSTGKIWQGEFKSQKKNGELITLHSIIYPKYNEQNEIYQFVALSTDITDKKNLEETLNEEKLTNLQISKLAELAEITAGVAHEINNPMAIIRSQFDFYKYKTHKKVGEDPDLIKHEKMIEEAIERVVKIIKNLVQYSQSSKGKAEPLAYYKVSEITQFPISMFTEMFKESGVRFETSIADVSVYCDRHQIEQVLINLLLNAFYETKKHTDPWIKLETKIIDDFVEFSVTDSGTGIPKEIQPKLIMPFFTTKPIGQGMGLGLSLSNKIIMEHAGSIYYDDRSPHTRFVFILPQSKESVIGSLNAEKAITSHINWKLKLIEEFKNKTSNLDAEKVRDCTICDLGKWIIKSNRIFHDDTDFQKLEEVHKKFHSCAADIVLKIQSGMTNEVTHLLSDSYDSEYNKLSAEVIDLLKKFKT